MQQQTSNARSVPDRTRKARRRRDVVASRRAAIAAIAEDLRGIDRNLEVLGERLPSSRRVFRVLAELGAGVRCVRNDLLADAIETLEALAQRSEAELRRCFEERQEWLGDGAE